MEVDASHTQGCNITGSGDPSTIGEYPIVVYLPNAPPPNATKDTYFTNTSTLTLDYSLADVQSFLEAAHLNGVKGFETGSETSDPDWPLALKCALVDRARLRAGLARSAACDTQMNKCKPLPSSPRSQMNIVTSTDCWSDGIADALTNYTSSTSGKKSAGVSLTSGGWIGLAAVTPLLVMTAFL